MTELKNELTSAAKIQFESNSQRQCSYFHFTKSAAKIQFESNSQQRNKHCLPITSAAKIQFESNSQRDRSNGLKNSVLLKHHLIIIRLCPQKPK